MATTAELDEAKLLGVIPREAQCAQCGYSLFALQTFRCPECGRAFDPTDQRTMWLGRPAGPIVRFLTAPVGKRTRGLVMAESAAVLWGAAWLPGAYAVITWAF